MPTKAQAKPDPDPDPRCVVFSSKPAKAQTLALTDKSATNEAGRASQRSAKAIFTSS